MHDAHAGAARTSGDGPYPRLILRNCNLIDGTGAPPRGPVDVIVQGNRIESIYLATASYARMQPAERPLASPRGREIDCTGKYVLPGLFDSHGHIGDAVRVPSADYVYRLWMGHGVTTVREPGCFGNGLDFVVAESRRSERNEIVAPRIHPYLAFGVGTSAPFVEAADALTWVHGAVERGARGLKLFGYRPDIHRAVLAEAGQLGIGTACHHSQEWVGRCDALTSARWGLSSIEHWYGIPEAMFTDRRLQHYAPGYNYDDEQTRFAESAQSWRQAAPPGSVRWRDTVQELAELGTALVPTFQAYTGMCDVERVMTSAAHRDYTADRLWSYWMPNPANHGSAFYDWTTDMEVAWRSMFAVWMSFVRDFHQAGGLLALGTDAGSIFKLWGFGTVEEMELYRVAGLSALEIITCATLNSARLLGVDHELGSVEPGKIADLIVVDEDPLANLKVLYGNGRAKMSGVGRTERTGGVSLTIKDGIVYDARALLQDVRDLVFESRPTDDRATTGSH